MAARTWRAGRGAALTTALAALALLSASSARADSHHKKSAKHGRHKKASFWGHDVEDAVSQVSAPPPPLSRRTPSVATSAVAAPRRAAA
jgi:hypothetical protein